VATSGTYERARTSSTHHRAAGHELASVTVIGPELTTADAYATAALAMGADAPGWLADLDGYEAQWPVNRAGLSTAGFKRL